MGLTLPAIHVSIVINSKERIASRYLSITVSEQGNAMRIC